MAEYRPIPETDPEPYVPEANPEDDFDVPINDYNADQTYAFDPTTSTPYQTAQKEKSGLPGPPDFS